MNEETLVIALAYKKEFEDEDTSDERRVELITWLQMRAEEDGYDLRCINCKKTIVIAYHYEAVAEGHTYSDAGEREVSLTRLCEFCFDKITEDPTDKWPDYYAGIADDTSP